MSRAGRMARSKLVEPIELSGLLREERSDGCRVVFTNGCFDLLHRGHLQLLEAAAGQGDLLVVAVNRDASVRRIKGAGRPIVTFEDRALLLCGLEAVDWVVGFDEETPLALIETLQPDVIVKGTDWAPERIVGREQVEARGGRVVRVPLLEERSTSRLLERLEKVDDSGSRSWPPT